MTTADTTRGLRAIAQALESLPGFPEASVTVSGTSISVQLVEWASTKTNRVAAVDMLLSLLDAGRPARNITMLDGKRIHYDGLGHLGEFAVNVFTPGIEADETVAATS